MKRLHRYAKYLLDEGHLVFMVHGTPSPTPYPFTPFHLPVLSLLEIPQFFDRDILVVPAAMTGSIQDLVTLPCRKVILALHWDSIFDRLPKNTSLQTFNLAHIITTCQTISDFFLITMGIGSTMIRPMIDSTLYHYNAKAKRNQICHITRGNMDGKGFDSETVLKIIFSNSDKFRTKGWTSVALSNVSEEEYAQVLRECKIFLTTSLREGAHLSMLEALACGCHVVGYSGVTGREYQAMDKDHVLNLTLFEAGDYINIARWFTSEPLLRDPAIQSHFIHERFLPEKERQGVLNFFNRFVQ